MLFISCAFCVDAFLGLDSILPPSSHQLAEFQQKLVEQAFLCDQNINKGWWGLALGDKAQISDCCSWRTFQCTEGLVKLLLLPRLKNHAFQMNADMLPPTLEYVHSTACTMKRFILSRLPRDLRYIYLRSASIREDTPPYKFPTLPTREFNTAHLPGSLEEAYFIFHTPVFHTVSIPLLPESLRLLHIENQSHIRHVFLDSNYIPSNLKVLQVLNLSNKKSVSFKSTKGIKIDGRIKVGNRGLLERTNPAEMRYFTTYEDLTSKFWWTEEDFANEKMLKERVIEW